MQRRASGVLMHITSLPSRFGIGDFGPGARRFARFLTQSSQSYWQILPLTPTSTYIGNSPYSSDSAFAVNPLLISPEQLVADGWLTTEEIEAAAVAGNPAVADYEQAQVKKDALLRLAFGKNRERVGLDAGFTIFCRDEAGWLDDYALFRAAKREHGEAGFGDWPKALRDRDARELSALSQRMAEEIEYVRFVQYLADGQWKALRAELRQADIQVIGDMPIYVTEDSADVWANPGLFKLGPDRRPVLVAGVPPDYFSETGQRWGNPVYDWPAHEASGFAWWLRRMERTLALYDIVRLDHFRGFEAYWEIPASEKTAVRGEWVKAPGRALFTALTRRFPALPLIAEDLGVITAEVRELMQDFGFPGMRVLQFAFGSSLAVNRDAPHNYSRNSVAYTGTHDNNTTLGWARSESGSEALESLYAYLGRQIPHEEVPWALLRLVMASAASKVVVPMQDLLCLGEGARMNMPSVAKGNWSWRAVDDQFEPAIAARLRAMTGIFGRNH
ncbi:4-alpha-glucanotransferase [Desulfovibrio sp. TomC]|uniref:4-alpha-glucanotransferase n=1 Tax=Desulfovibrio sp. TomC TaxID=1562888 RepID=UPI0005756E69|nr:4-alpha-glucanotransferase [Desulfovibrio sp. TomC]KHK01434.1 4-alpha-glucanotransferase (amylomaltase) [Desulfovibrio sp. TomC]